MPRIRYENTTLLLLFSRDSGRMCRKAPPISAPAEKPIRQKRILCNRLPLMERVKIPTKDIRLTKAVLARIQNKTIIGNYPKQGFLPLLAFLERQLSFPLRFLFPMPNPCNKLTVHLERYSALLQADIHK